MSRRKKTLFYVFSLSTLLFLGVAIDLACGPEPDPYDYSVSFFHNNISGDKSYRAFYFTSSQFLYEDIEPQSEEDINSRDWATYLGGNVKPAEVKRVMYRLDHKTDSVLLSGYLNLKKGLPDSLKHNNFLRALKRNKGALLYYRFVKIVEPGACRQDRWSWQSVDTNFLEKNAAYALKEATMVKGKFLKTRYYYQAQRLFHYTGHDKQAIDVYEKHIANTKPGYYIKGLTFGLRAGEELRTGNKAESAYLFSKLFKAFPERRIQAYQNFVNIKVPVKNVIAAAKNNHERAVIYAMNGFYMPKLSTQYLKEVYNTDARSPFVEMLLTREINKLEIAYLSPKLTDKLPYNNLNPDYYNWSEYLKKEKNIGKHINELKAFCTLLANERKCKDPAIGFIARAYLEWMTGKNQTGLDQLKQIPHSGLNTRLYDQQQLVKLLLITQKLKRLDSVTEQELVPSLTWLDKKVREELKYGGEEIKFSHYYDSRYRLKRFVWSARDVYQKL